MTAHPHQPGVTLLSDDDRSQAGAILSPRVGTALNGKYVLERHLGGGGMAEVFLARTVGAEGFSRRVAIKRVLPGFSNNAQFAQLFISEAQLTSRLVHTNCVSVLDFDRDSEGRLFLVMELVDGTDLDGLLETGPLPFSLVIYLGIEALRGLDYAHELPVSTDGVRGIVHRDISPHNVLLGWDGAVKVSDFGIAKSRAATDATASQIIKGKPAYMSPEQARGAPLDGRSDLFSVGVMLFEMLCLRPLFAGATTEETLARLFFEPIPAPRDLRPEIPEDLSRAVASLLVRERDQRTPTAKAAIAALGACADHPRDGRDELIAMLSQRFVGRAPVRARDVSHASHLDATLVADRRTATAPPRSPSDLHRAKHRNRRWLWAILVTLLVFGTTVGVLALTARAPKPVETVKPTSNEVPAGASAAPSAPSASPPEPMTPPPEPPLTTIGREGAPTPGAPTTPSTTAPSTAAGPDHTPASRAPAHRKQSTPPKTTGIREIHLRADGDTE